MYRGKILALLLALFVSLVPLAHGQAGVRKIPVTSKLFQMKLSPDGNTIAVFEDYNVQSDEPLPVYLPIRLLDRETGDEIARLKVSDYATDAAFTPDSARLATYQHNGFIDLWDATNGKHLKRIPAMPAPYQIKFFPDGKTLLALQGSAFSVLLWNTDSGAITEIIGPRPATYKDFKAKYLSAPFDWLAFADVSPDGKTIVTMSVLGEISFWDVATQRQTPVGPATVPGYADMLRKSSPSFSPDGKLVLYADYGTGQDDHAIRVLDVATRKEIASVPVKVDSVRKFFDVAGDGDTLAWAELADGNVTVHLWSIAGNASRGDVPVATGVEKGAPTLSFTPDGSQVVVGGFFASDSNNAVYVVDVPK